MRRKAGTLVPIEEGIIGVAKMFLARPVKRTRFYGYELKFHLAVPIRKGSGVYGAYRGAATGGLYRALRRLEEMGYLTSSWSTPLDNHPPRRYYVLTKRGEEYNVGQRLSQ